MRVTLEFDDNWPTHFSHVAPALEERGFRGVFACIPGMVYDWTPWGILAARGHEIANHTFGHRYFKDLKPSEARDEVVNGFALLADHIGQPQSFTYPGGSCPEWGPGIVRQLHSSARYRHGIEYWPPEDPQALRGVGWYAPFDLGAMNAALDEAIEVGGWYIGYWHAMTMGGESKLQCPTGILEAHLDYIAAKGVEVVTRREAIGNLSAIDSKS